MTTIISYKNFISLGIALFAMFFIAPVAFAGGSATIETMPASYVNTHSATLNAYFNSEDEKYSFNQQEYAPEVLFEYGTSKDFGKATPAKRQSMGARTISVQVSGFDQGETVYYRAVMYTDEGVKRGSTEKVQIVTKGTVFSFPDQTIDRKKNNTTPGVNTSGNNGNGGTSVNATLGGGKGGNGEGNGNEYVFLSIENGQEKVNQGDIVVYEVKYENISGRELENVTLMIEMPEEMTVLDTTGLKFNETKDGLTVKLGDLKAGENDTAKITARTNKRSIDNQVIARVDAIYGIGKASNQDVATAYDIDDYTGLVNVALGASVFGAGFFPATLAGWLIMIGLILLVVFLARRFYFRKDLNERWFREDTDDEAMNPKYSN